MPIHATTRTIRARGLLGLICVAVVALTTACSSTPDAGTDEPATPAPTSSMPTPTPTPTETPTSAPPAAAEVQLTIKDFKFMVPASVPPGATITVVNDDAMAHTVTSSKPGTFDVTIAGGATETFTAPAQAGSYEFVCNFHGNMTGTLVVA